MFGLFEKKPPSQTAFVIDKVETEISTTLGTPQVHWEVWYRKDGVEYPFLSNICYQSTINGLVFQAVKHESIWGTNEIVVADDTGGYRDYIAELEERGVYIPPHFVVKKDAENAA